MLPDLERLIRLQQIDTAVATARQTVDGFPARSASLDARIAERRAHLEAAERRQAADRTARQALEKTAAEVQSRLTRFKEQLMDVKTNKEYHAMQAEIATAETKLRGLEDQILERMLEGDELTAVVDAARQAVATEEASVADERRALEAERDRLQAEVERLAADRASVVADITAEVLSRFETLARGRGGVAVAAARDGRCAACQVRLRPQLYNDVRLNKTLIQCETCQRILYFAADAGVTTPSS